MRIMLVNNFHNTRVTLRVSSLPVTLSVGQTRRVRRTLCGMRSDCTCGAVRGPQWAVLRGVCVRLLVSEEAPDQWRVEAV